MKSKLSLAVIIPTYNSADTIVNCLDSLRKQTLKPKDIIVIDDTSIDNTVAKLKVLSFIKLFQQPHQGPAIARNLGASKTSADILVFVDADMEFAPDFLAMLTRPIFTGRAKGTWSGNEWVKNWHNPWARCWNYNQNRPDSKMTDSQPGQKKVFRAILKSEFDKVKGFDHIGYTDDWTLVSKLGYQPTPTTAKFYHHNPDSLLKIFHQARWIGKRKRKFGKFGSLIAAFRANAAFSLIIGLFKSLKHLTLHFVVFKLVYDLGILLGALERLADKKY